MKVKIFDVVTLIAVSKLGFVGPKVVVSGVGKIGIDSPKPDSFVLAHVSQLLALAVNQCGDWTWSMGGGLRGVNGSVDVTTVISEYEPGFDYGPAHPDGGKVD